MDAIIHFLSSLLNGLPPTLAACGMFVVQDLFNVLVPSGSGSGRHHDAHYGSLG